MIKVSLASVGQRQFLVLGDVAMIPVDRIKHFDLQPANGGCDNSVRIVTDDPEDDWIFSYENADAIKSWIDEQNGD